MRVAVAIVAFALAACSRLPADPESLPAATAEPVVEQAVAAAPLPQAQEAVAPSVTSVTVAAQELVQAVVDPAPVQPPPPEPAEAACRRAAASLIVRWEVSSEAYYRQKLIRPIWPKGQSGVTWGIGYDGGHQTARTIGDDWQAHEHAERLATTAGITGQRAGDVLARYRDIVTVYPYAYEVFETRSLIEYHRQTQRAFRDGFDALCPYACAALTSTVYNRGAAMTGDSRREMRVIRDECVPAQDYACIARELRSMTRLWKGTVNEAGLSARREDEALLALQCLSPAATGAGDG